MVRMSRSSVMDSRLEQSWKAELPMAPPSRDASPMVGTEVSAVHPIKAESPTAPTVPVTVSVVNLLRS